MAILSDILLANTSAYDLYVYCGIFKEEKNHKLEVLNRDRSRPGEVTGLPLTNILVDWAFCEYIVKASFSLIENYFRITFFTCLLHSSTLSSRHTSQPACFARHIS